MDFVLGSNALALTFEVEEKLYDNYDRAEAIWDYQKLQYGITDATYDYPPEFLEEIKLIIDKLDVFASKSGDKLKVKNAKKVSYFLWDWVNEYIHDHNLCPECFHELEWQEQPSLDWYEPDGAKRYCNNCDFSEDL